MITGDIKELLEHDEESEDSEINEEAKKITKYLKMDEDGEGEDEEADMEMEEDEEGMQQILNNSYIYKLMVVLLLANLTILF